MSIFCIFFVLLGPEFLIALRKSFKASPLDCTTDRRAASDSRPKRCTLMSSAVRASNSSFIASLRDPPEPPPPDPPEPPDPDPDPEAASTMPPLRRVSSTTSSSRRRKCDDSSTLAAAVIVRRLTVAAARVVVSSIVALCWLSASRNLRTLLKLGLG